MVVDQLERRMSEAYNVSIVDYITTGNVLGELNFLTKSLRDKTVRCETPVTVGPKLRASLSGTFLQTLPDSGTPLKKGTLYFRAAVQRRGQRPPKGLGTDKTVEAT